MPELLRMPEVAAGATHAVLSSWTVPEGEDYTTSTVIAIIETDKAIVDYEAEADGVIVRRLAAEGAEVAIGDPIALIAAHGETVADIDAALAALGGSSAADAPPEAPPEASSTAAPAEAAEAPTPAVVTGTSDASSGGTRLFASPLARRLAKERGIDLSTIRGSGPNGRIRRRDLDQAPAATATPPVSAAPIPAPASAAGYTDVPHTRLRRAIATRLTQSVTTAPHFYLRGSARVDRLMALRAELNAGEDVRVSVNDLVIKAVAGAHARVPAANAIWMDDAIRMFDGVDIAVAIATDTGLVTPVLRGVESLSITQVAAATKDFATRARAGELRQIELEGGSTSVSNLGMFGTEEFAAIINPPHSSILAVGAAAQEPVVVDGVIEVGTVMRVTLSVDHRPIDGAVAAQWMKVFLELLEHPAKILA
jgi:pyruvate dehydrogenase E2 component (dihydrolipoamide acetyltransferase)